MKNNVMHCVRISIFLHNLEGGGAEKISINLANAFVERGFAVDMVLLRAEGALLSALDPGVRVVDLKVDRVRWSLLPLVRYLRSERPAALLANMWPLTLNAVWARALARVPVRLIVAEHTTWSRSELLVRPTVGWQVCQTMHHFFPRADGIVAVSQGAADDLARFAGLQRSSISVIYNPVVDTNKSPNFSLPVAPAGWCQGSHQRVLAVGTLKAIKDYATLLEAFALLCRTVEARLLILGEGECRAALEAQARLLGIEGVVFMPGFVTDPAPYYQHAHLHVISSTGEGFANVIAEALAAGTPVVSTDCPCGPREILADGQFGRLVPVSDAAALAYAMQETLAATHDRSALVARAKHFSIERAVDQYLALLFPQ